MSTNFENYEAHRTSDEETGLRLFSLRDRQWGINGTFVEFNKHFDVHAGIAYIGARTSRSEDSTVEIFRTVMEASKTDDGFSGEKLAGIFTGYGHASVADMAPVMMFFDDLPMHLAYRLFKCISVGGGQELSTRYVKLEDFGLPTFEQLIGREIEGSKEVSDSEEWTGIQAMMADLYNKWYGKLRLSLDQYLNENYDGKVKDSTLDSRTLDVVRMFIPFGSRTRQTFLGSARNWVDLASQLRSSGDPQSVAYGDHIDALLSLEEHPDFGDIQAHLKGLTKYGEGSDSLGTKIADIRGLAENLMSHRIFEPYTDNRSAITELLVSDGSGGMVPMTMGEALIASYFGAALPTLRPEDINQLVETVTPRLASKIGQIIFEGHTHHNLMRSQADIRGIPLWYESALAFHRDINRQRAMGRNALMLGTDCAAQVIGAGYNENYTMRMADYWSADYGNWSNDMAALYERIVSYVDRLSHNYGENTANSAAINLMPLGNQVNMLLSGPPSQWNYMTSLRVALGGDFGYRDDVWNMLEIIRKREPIFAHMASHLVKPDVNDPVQIVGRS